MALYVQRIDSPIQAGKPQPPRLNLVSIGLINLAAILVLSGRWVGKLNVQSSSIQGRYRRNSIVARVCDSEPKGIVLKKLNIDLQNSKLS